MDTVFVLALWEYRIENGDCLHVGSVRMTNWEWRLSSCGGLRMENLEWRLSSCGLSENGELRIETACTLVLWWFRIDDGDCLHVDSVRIENWKWRISSCGQRENGKLRMEILFCGQSENGELRIMIVYMLVVWECRIENRDCLHAHSLNGELRLSSCGLSKNVELTIETFFVWNVE